MFQICIINFKVYAVKLVKFRADRDILEKLKYLKKIQQISDILHVFIVVQTIFLKGSETFKMTAIKLFSAEVDRLL